MSNFYISFAFFFSAAFVCNLVVCDDNIIDLSWGFDENTVYWPGHRGFEFTKETESNHSGYWYAANEFCAGEHGGTHLDAPRHFNPEGWTVGEIPLSRLIISGITIDVTEDVNESEGNATLKVEHIKDWITKNGEIPENSALLVRFGWSQYYNNKSKYFGSNNGENLNFPGISKEAAEWISNDGRIVAVGLDTPSLDAGFSKNFSAHRILLGNQIYGMENLHIPKELPATDFLLYVLPMKITKGTGAPLRVVAVIRNDMNFRSERLTSGSHAFSPLITISCYVIVKVLLHCSIR